MIKTLTAASKRSRFLILIAGTALLLSSCTKLGEFNDGLNSMNNPAFIVDNTVYSHVVKNVAIATLPANGGSPADLQLSLTVDTGRAGFSPLTSFCNLTGTSPCKCELSWTEINTVGGGSTSVQRSRRFDLTEVQSGLVRCKMTQSFWNEIANGTTIRMNIVRYGVNTTGLSCQAVGYKKGTSTTANGDFLDDTLTPFRNIHRYSCFSKRNSSYEILNQYTPTQNQAGSSSANVLLGSKFCTGVAGGLSGQCANPRSGFSAQSYYRNLYIRSDKMGEINSTNSYYDCPKVIEPIPYSAGQTIPSSEQNKYWPLDATFALATQYSSEWSVGVRSGTILHKNGDPNSVSDACVNEDVAKRLSERGIIIKCLGYAKPPKPNGSCGQITDNNGRVRPMVRLRRYRVIYPTTYQSNGQVESGGTEADEVYVADRIVIGPTGEPTGGMIYGPKPCNFSWFDHEGVINRDGVNDFQSQVQNSQSTVANLSRPAYVATTNYEYQDTTLAGNPTWSVNPDGLVLPRFDRDGMFGNLYGPYCSATIPVVEELMGTPNSVRLLTSHEERTDFIQLGARRIYLREIHIKPIDPWSPNYVEDTSFKACAPVADPYLEPPLHFYKKDANTVAWCAKSYPTQNPYWLDLNARKKPLSANIADVAVNYGGGGLATVSNYTSHQSGAGDLATASCSSTNGAAICAMTGVATADCAAFLNFPGRVTCDRTVTFDGNQAYRGFPLQAEDTAIAEMLSQDLNKDRSYSCQYSVHPDSTKINARIPISGCCGMVAGVPVINGVLNGASETLPTAFDGAQGHLEPYLNGAVPSIRFCGNPVDVQ